MGVKGLGGETAGMNSQELKHLELNSHVAVSTEGFMNHPPVDTDGHQLVISNTNML